MSPEQLKAQNEHLDAEARRLRVEVMALKSRLSRACAIALELGHDSPNCSDEYNFCDCGLEALRNALGAKKP